jgi:hypothetical protein
MKKANNQTPGSNITVRVGGNAIGNAIGDGASVRAKIIAGGNVGATDEIESLFARIDQAISVRADDPSVDKEEIVEAINSLKEIVKAGQAPDEALIKRRLRAIARMAPDILDVIIETFKSPLAGIGAVVRKIALRVKEEAQA